MAASRVGGKDGMREALCRGLEGLGSVVGGRRGPMEKSTV